MAAHVSRSSRLSRMSRASRATIYGEQTQCSIPLGHCPPVDRYMSIAAHKSPLCDPHRQSSLSGNGRASSFTLANWVLLTTTAGGTFTDLSSTSSPTARFSYYW